jgi:hypothetical protein
VASERAGGPDRASRSPNATVPPVPTRPTRHHRSHPMGDPRHGPTIQDPQTRIMILERPWVLPLENVLDIIQRGVDSTLLAVGHHALHDSHRCDRLSRAPCSALSHTTSLVTRTSASPDRSHRHKEERYRSSDRSWTSLDLLSTALIPGPHLYTGHRPNRSFAGKPWGPCALIRTATPAIAGRTGSTRKAE